MEEKFKKINEAYSVLSDPNNRNKYDNPPQQHNPFDHWNVVKTQSFNTPITIKVNLSLEDLFKEENKNILYRGFNFQIVINIVFVKIKVKNCLA